ncbi:hypothetical protein CNEO2_260042 [Clostridium neonatale]|uniref:Uncharacterized protein n=1 Tax=Clostridium neonatale TaxID=137838 RepID=A0AAD2DD26_9CLOT|nr:hypothetical protein CNEO2_200042 [Clostridium neonatale]CAI3201822.1 hypothetical protein CNEO2_240042 [Clostridium neonatale]CAI3216133.1 hypothetical protein CNEO2_80042 [Clostridium neonatale]CAI3226746.1 hypothetical protein CNEO2_150042 [Clostridium neonatale]CAI3228126.1 hypothetical protein CNEO2_170038 [Clostridium neonatale]
MGCRNFYTSVHKSKFDKPNIKLGFSLKFWALYLILKYCSSFLFSENNYLNHLLGYNQSFYRCIKFMRDMFKLIKHASHSY